MRDHIIDFGLFLFLALIWSSSFLLIKIGVDTIPPLTLTAARLCIAAAVLWLYLAVLGEGISMDPRSLAMYVAVALLGHCIPYAMIGWGETRISSSLAAILMGIMPVSTVFLAHWLIPDEPMNRRKFLGIAISFFGLLLLVGVATLSQLGESIWGQLGVLGGAISYSLCTIYIRSRKQMKVRELATGTCTAGALISLVPAFLFEDPLLLEPTADSLWSVITLGLLPTAFANLLYFRLIQRLGASTFSQINYLIPILGGLWGIWLLREPFSWNVFGSLFLVLCGLYLVQKSNAATRVSRSSPFTA
ncbi:MAG: DMT family transporter [Gammaproteobacteria bacterium]|nr:DMT family transporter [Gammaproteobacteria bacterium]MYD76792.1 DMT family transporter [Gammaproteobacteria bacterium]